MPTQTAGQRALQLLKSIGGAVASPFRKGIGIGQELVLGNLSDEEKKRRQQLAGSLGTVSQATQLTQPEQQQFREKPGKFAGKTLAGQTAFAVPGGQSTRLAKILAAGGAGALAGFGGSEEGKEVQGTLGGAATGAATMGLLTSKPAKKLAESLGKLTKNFGKSSAAQVSKASPSAFQKASDKGIDINKSIAKYMPAGSNIDDMVGDVAQRGKGGLVSDLIQSSESQIDDVLSQSGDDIIASTDDILTPLIKQSDKLAGVPGNKPKTKALNEFIDETKQLYPDGFTAKKLLEIKRIFDDRFGKSVVDDTGGAVISDAQKKMANTARKILKEKFGDIKKALDTESELYVLRPILNRAKAIGETQGSTIRRGSISAVDVTKPGTIIDTITSQPRVASTLSKLQNTGGAIQSAGQKLPSLSNLPPELQQLLSTATTTGVQPQATQPQQGAEQLGVQQGAEQVSPGIQASSQEDLLAQLQQNGIDPAVAQEFTQGLTGGTQQQQQTGQITAEMASMAQLLLPAKEAKKFKDAYDIQQKAQKTSSDKESEGSAVNALTQLEDLYFGTKDDKGSLSLGEKSVGLSGLLSKAGATVKKQTDQAFVDRLQNYKQTQSFLVGVLNKARDAGVLNAGEYEVMINNMPDEYSTETQAKDYFSEVKKFLQNKPNIDNAQSQEEQILELLQQQGLNLGQ